VPRSLPRVTSTFQRARGVGTVRWLLKQRCNYQRCQTTGFAQPGHRTAPVPHFSFFVRETRVRKPRARLLPTESPQLAPPGGRGHSDKDADTQRHRDGDQRTLLGFPGDLI
jgi:hypothetical protein